MVYFSPERAEIRKFERVQARLHSSILVYDSTYQTNKKLKSFLGSEFKVCVVAT